MKLTTEQAAIWRSYYTEWQTDGLIDIDAGRLALLPGEDREDAAHRYAVEQFVENAGPWPLDASYCELVRAVGRAAERL